MKYKIKNTQPSRIGIGLGEGCFGSDLGIWKGNKELGGMGLRVCGRRTPPLPLSAVPWAEEAWLTHQLRVWKRVKFCEDNPEDL